MIRKRFPRSRQNRRHAVSRRGAAAVELAIVLPVIATLLLGSIESGRGIMVGQILSNAVRSGARVATIEGSTNQAVIDMVRNFAAPALGVSPSQISVTIGISNTAAAGQLSNAGSKDLVTVTASVPYTEVAYVPANFMAGRSISASCTMRHE
jgi:Flp pilus assembly protein TadG